MKTFTILVTLLLTTVFQNAYAQNVIVCREIESKQETKIEIVITHLRSLPMSKAEKKELDSKSEVRVQLKEVKSGRVVNSKTFNAVETSYDVQVWINNKTLGFHLYQYLDEDDQDGFSIINLDGSKSEHRLNCTDQ